MRRSAVEEVEGFDEETAALSADVALLLTVHPSNYEIRGYTKRPEAGQIARNLEHDIRDADAVDAAKASDVNAP